MEKRCRQEVGAAADSGRISRRGLLGLAAGCLTAAFTRPARADLFGGDITVLLAQLEQQLTLVSNAIATVQRVTETAQRAAKMVEHAKQLGAMVTGRGGLDGFLRGLKGIVDTGRGAVNNLQTLNVRGGYWKDRISATAANHGNWTLRDTVRMSQEASDLDRRFLRDVNQMAKSFATVGNSFDALQSAADAVNEAASVTGVVGQVQLLGRETLQLVGISAQLHDSIATMGSMQADELARQAADRETGRAKVEILLNELEIVEPHPAEIRWDLDRE